MAEKKKKGKKLLKVFLILFLLALLVIGGFILGIYLQIIDSKEVNEKLGLYNLPLVGEYFVKPVPVPTEEEMGNKPLEDVKPAPEKEPEKKDEKEKKEDKKPKKIVLSKEEIEKQMKEREAAERKRISKLARLYGQMKPQEAADAMQDLDDDLTATILQRMDESQAAKILAKFEPARTAQLMGIIYAGTQKRMTTPEDLRGASEEGASAEETQKPEENT